MKGTLRERSTAATSAFTLLEMLVVIAIIGILLSIGAIGLSAIGGKGVGTAVSTTEALFDEARSTAVARKLRSCVLVAKALENNSSDDLRRMVVAYEEIDPATGGPADPSNPDPNWIISSRGLLLPDQVYFSAVLSRRDHQSGSEEIPTTTLTDVKSNFVGEYYVYRFNAEGVCLTPGASFVIGRGARLTSRPSTVSPPKVMASAKRDFGGFVIWRNGGTSMFRSPTQISDALPAPGQAF